jgi:hypothetical protein
MRKTLIAASLAVLGFATYTAFANPSLDTTPNSMWRNAPEATAAQTEAPKPAYQQEEPFSFNP